MSDKPACSIIIPSYRSTKTIGACLTALVAQDYAGPYEIIVVDSSPDETPELVRRMFPAVRLIHLPQQTDPAQARNIGAEHASGDVLAFIDSDCTAGSRWLSQLAATIEEGYDGVGGATSNANGDTLVSWAGYMCEFREFLPEGKPHDVWNLSLNNVAYRRDSFYAAGCFPVGYFPQEDQVFHATMRELKLRLCFDPGIVVAHMHRTERTAFLHHQRCIGRANAQVLREIDLAGTPLARNRWLALLALPALVPFRFTRTILACWKVEFALVFRRPTVAWLCWLGMCWWGLGFLEGANGRRSWSIIRKGH
ncbi:MAG: glycosyltransferase [Chloroflexota bacterium]|nr:glycosyltransferase [Chloroflexota bacterium]